MFEASKRIKELPPYLFAKLDEEVREAKRAGMDIIDLGVGDPDMPPPKRMLDELKCLIDSPRIHSYPPYGGTAALKEEAALFLKERHGIDVDPRSQVLILIGSKEGLSHLPLAVIDNGDIVGVPDPYFPAYLHATILAGGRPYMMRLREEDGFLPRLSDIPKDILSRTRLVFLNYPNNPTTATATADFFEEVVYLARKYGFVVCHDAAYIDIAVQNAKQPALMSIKGAKDVSVEFFTFSKVFNICGWRIGVCVGNKDIISSLLRTKMVVDSGQFMALEEAVRVGIRECSNFVDDMCDVYKERRKVLEDALVRAGFVCYPTTHTFYIWAKVPQGLDSAGATSRLLEATGVVAAPGSGFGEGGEGYVRFSLTAPTEKICEAASRISAARLI